MALSLVLYNASYWLALEANPYGVRFGSALGEFDENVVFASPWGRGFAPVVGANVGNRQAAFTIKLRGSSLDNWVVNSRQLRTILREARDFAQSDGVRGDQAYLSVQLNGLSYAIEYDVLSGKLGDDKFADFLMTIQNAPQLLDVPLLLVLKPFGRPQALTRVISGTLDNGDDVYVLTAPVGDRPIPCRVTLATAAGDQYGEMLVARRSRGTVADYLFALECETGTFTGYVSTDIVTGAAVVSNVVQAAAHNGNVRRVTYTAAGGETDAPILRWTLNTNLDALRGRYFVYLKNGSNSGAATALSITYGGLYGTDIVGPAVTVQSGAPNCLNYCGVMEIPHRSTPSNQPLPAFLFTLRATWPNSSFTWDLDCLYLIPADSDFLDVTIAGGGAEQDQLVNDGLLPVPSLYLLDSSGDLKANALTATDTRFTLEPNADNLFLAIGTDSSGAVDLTDDFTLTVEYFPLYEFFR